ncbi:hypothetical protein PIB30_106406, partial [Stylosanthes scabra]|nr:hypothetical protein [Stylosanthes scabra]
MWSVLAKSSTKAVIGEAVTLSLLRGIEGGGSADSDGGLKLKRRSKEIDVDVCGDVLMDE